MARQEITRNWWNTNRRKHEFYISQVVLDEISMGDAKASIKRVESLDGIPVLEINDEVLALSTSILASGVMPQKAFRDSMHIALASVHKIDILLTWNCRHIANPLISRQIRKIVQRSNFQYPEICTPEEMMGE